MAVLFLKSRSQTAPTDIAGQDFLFLCRCRTVFSLDLFQSADSGNIGLKLCFLTALTESLVCNGEVFCLFSLFLLCCCTVSNSLFMCRPVIGVCSGDRAVDRIFKPFALFLKGRMVFVAEIFLFIQNAPVKQFTERNLCVSVLLVAAESVLGKADLQSLIGENLLCQVLPNHDTAVSCR